MKRALVLLLGLICWRVVACRNSHAGAASLDLNARTNLQIFQVAGVVKQVNARAQSVLIQHQSISNYMEAMTMPFRVKDTNQLSGLLRGDQISFRLLVKSDESWIDQITKTPKPTSAASSPLRSPIERAASNAPQSQANKHDLGGGHPLINYNFTNEFGQPITLGSFQGQALGITFFFTRCPIPDYCPRLSRNFEEASQKLLTLPNAPTNWHFLSVSIDPQMDTPAVLRAYGHRYHYNSNHWSFLTGPVEKVRELAEQSGVTYEPENGLFNHNFRTLVIDTAGRMQTSFPIGGNLSEALVTEILKATASTNKPPP
jgi:protein SCO1/2